MQTIICFYRNSPPSYHLYQQTRLLKINDIILPNINTKHLLRHQAAHSENYVDIDSFDFRVSTKDFYNQHVEDDVSLILDLQDFGWRVCFLFQLNSILTQP